MHGQGTIRAVLHAMRLQPSAGWKPTRTWFYALFGVVISETALLLLSIGSHPVRPSLSSVPSAASFPPAILPVPPPPASPVLSPADDNLVAAASERDPLSRALSTHRPLQRAHRFEDLGASLAATDPRETSRVLRGLALTDRLPFVRGMFDTLGRGDRVDALMVAKDLPDDSEKEAALTTLIALWTADGNGVSSADTRADRVSRHGLVAGLGMELLDHADPDLVVQWANLLTTGKARAALLGAAAASLVPTDPVRAVALGNGLADDDRSFFNLGVAQALATHSNQIQPQAVLAWSNSVMDPALHTAVRKNLFVDWSRVDAPAAAQAAAQAAAGLGSRQCLEYRRVRVRPTKYCRCRCLGANAFRARS